MSTYEEDLAEIARLKAENAALLQKKTKKQQAEIVEEEGPPESSSTVDLGKIERMRAEAEQLKAENAALRAGKVRKPSEKQIAEYERIESEKKATDHILAARHDLAMAMAKIKDQIEPYVEHVRMRRKLTESSREEIEQIAWKLRVPVLLVADSVKPDEVEKITGTKLADQTKAKLKTIHAALRICAAILENITVAAMDEADTADDPETPKNWNGEHYFRRAWKEASMSLLRAFKYFFYITGDMPTKTIRLSKVLSDAWRVQMILGADAKQARKELNDLIDKSTLPVVERRAIFKKLDSFSWEEPGYIGFIAKKTLQEIASRMAPDTGKFVEIIDSSSDILATYSPHANVSAYVQAMAHRTARHVANPAPLEAKVLVDWIKWVERDKA